METGTAGYSKRAAAGPPLVLPRLALCGGLAHSVGVSSKQIVQDLLGRIPDDASLSEIAREIEFVAAVRKGLEELDRGEEIPIEQVERELPSWIIK